MAIAFHPKFEYVAVDVSGAGYLVAAELAKVTAEKCGWGDYRVITAVPGTKKYGWIARPNGAGRVPVFVAVWVTASPSASTDHRVDSRSGHG